MLINAQNAKHFEMNDVNLHPHGGLAELVDCTGLENRRTARYRGFESLSLRNEEAPASAGVFHFQSFPDARVNTTQWPVGTYVIACADGANARFAVVR